MGEDQSSREDHSSGEVLGFPKEVVVKAGLHSAVSPDPTQPGCGPWVGLRAPSPVKRLEEAVRGESEGSRTCPA